jgi:hypothetical protein
MVLQSSNYKALGVVNKLSAEEYCCLGYLEAGDGRFLQNIGTYLAAYTQPTQSHIPEDKIILYY